MKTTLNPYLAFNGNAREVMDFYHSVLGGELTMQTYQESGMSKDSKDGDNIMHAQLQNDTVVLMASDGNEENLVHMGNNVSLSLVGTDAELLKGYFEKLSVGGKVTLPLAKQAWGDEFGMFTDKFGIHWMVNISSEKQA